MVGGMLLSLRSLPSLRLTSHHESSNGGRRREENRDASSRKRFGEELGGREIRVLLELLERVVEDDHVICGRGARRRVEGC